MIRVHPVRNPGALVYHSTTTSCSDSVVTALAADTEGFDDEHYHSTSVNNSRLTAPRPGLYIATFSAYFAANATGYRGGYIGVNGSLLTSDQNVPGAANGNIVFVRATATIRLVPGDYVEAFGLSVGATVDCNLDSARSFSISYIGP